MGEGAYIKNNFKEKSWIWWRDSFVSKMPTMQEGRPEFGSPEFM